MDIRHCLILTLVFLFTSSQVSTNNAFTPPVVSFANVGTSDLNSTIVGVFGKLFNATFSNFAQVENSIKNFVFFDNVTTDHLFFHYWLPGPNNYNRSILLDSTNATDFLANFTNFTIIISGWLSPDLQNFVADMAYALNTNTQEKYNVLSVDWLYYSKNYNYIYVAQYVQIVAKFLGEFLIHFQQNYSSTIFDNTHLIGHSLGAQISGIAGEYVKNKTEKSLAWITGLDPAAPLFTTLVPLAGTNILKKSDAQFVDIIHTSIILLGYTEPMGTVDFYLNFGGPVQPECANTINVFTNLHCSHNYATIYYTNTINNLNLYTGTKCNDRLLYGYGLCTSNERARMGLHVSKNDTGSYFVFTNSSGY